ncbi:unnamed protein product [Ilex paraguariensis]|uniref:Uncharacterized protein n=1 Tax=Ilex paraguariensis TaxID=185542 RepID=A0ABC8R8F2_9AQUA
MRGSGVIVDESFGFEQETHLTVHKTSIFFSGDGFIVYDPKGEVIFRVESYGPDSQSNDELFLMNSSGKCLLTLHRKKPSLHQRWEGFVGEKMDGQEPSFSVHRSSIIGRSGRVVEVYGNPAEEYQIEGSFPQRSCTVSHISSDGSSKELVAQIKRKVDPTTNVMLGKDVFLICLKPGVDSAFIMGLVLVLDQMDGDDFDDLHEVGPTVEVLSS